MSLRTRRFLSALMACVMLIQPALASVVIEADATSAHSDGTTPADAALNSPIASAKLHGQDTAQVSEARGACIESHALHSHHHGCEHGCHACAHLLGLPACTLSIGCFAKGPRFPWRHSSWPSQHRSPPERPPRAIA